jgi:hypothetical protein
MRVALYRTCELIFSEHSVTTEWTVSEHSMDIKRTIVRVACCRACERTFREHVSDDSASFQENFGEH